jgi:hypothetical protein
MEGVVTGYSFTIEGEGKSNPLQVSKSLKSLVIKCSILLPRYLEQEGATFLSFTS